MTLVFIKGNPNYGTPQMHQDIENVFKKIAKDLSIDFISIDSDSSSVPFKLELIKDAVYVGFSRGTRYFKKIKGTKIGIGSNKGTYSFVNPDDKTANGDISDESLQAHFKVNNIKKIKQILKNENT